MAAWNGQPAQGNTHVCSRHGLTPEAQRFTGQMPTHTLWPECAHGARLAMISMHMTAAPQTYKGDRCIVSVNLMVVRADGYPRRRVCALSLAQCMDGVQGIWQ